LVFLPATKVLWTDTKV